MRSGEGKICAAVLVMALGAPTFGQVPTGRTASAPPTAASSPASPAKAGAQARTVRTRRAPKPAGAPPRPGPSQAGTESSLANAPVPAAPAGTPPQPIGRVAEWFPADSYPPKARAKSEEGKTVYAVDLDAQGRVLRCNIVQSSGSDLLDSTTCTQVISNGRFRPARDAGGKPVPGRYQGSMRWQLVEGAASAE